MARSICRCPLELSPCACSVRFGSIATDHDLPWSDCFRAEQHIGHPALQRWTIPSTTLGLSGLPAAWHIRRASKPRRSK